VASITGRLAAGEWSDQPGLYKRDKKKKIGVIK
jgi:hypothetical protein